jgi:hypothetical protein
VPGEGRQQIQPVHVDDVAAAIVRALRNREFPRARVAAVGPEPLALRDYLAMLRAGMGLSRTGFVLVPRSLVAFAARLGIGWGDAESLRMLDVGNTGDPAPFARLLDHPPRAAREFIAPEEADDLRMGAAVLAFAPVLRLSIAFMWFAAAVVSLGVFPVEDSLAMLARTGLTNGFATWAVYGASALDLVLGVATLFVRRRMLWSLQLLLVLGYTAIITVFLPEQWLHPFGPVVKNVPIVAAILLLRALEPR